MRVVWRRQDSVSLQKEKLAGLCGKWKWFLFSLKVSQNYVNPYFKDRIRTVVSSVPREMCVRALNGTVARWLLCVKQDGEQVETVL